MTAKRVKWTCTICGDEFEPTATQLKNQRSRPLSKRHACFREDCRKILRWRGSAQFGPKEPPKDGVQQQ